MKKNRKQPKQPKQRDERKPTLKDSLNNDLLTKLQETKKDLVNEENRRAEEEKKKKAEAKKRIEQNKSFEELLEESGMDWRDYKK
ncbi:YqkE family protein [Jeotgalibacillus proteolyticus]|uniref:DUF3886 domain-containing protein n=1 Tax=Jeotgalibacillus proteolyticus TaxID=2082395 RepID=A0A2S5GEI0_9BACL|nr:YqkE family protein [Jeotgalibacillus proteolyticus]PPA71321.1 DUF3886 domain-containing protein [Jeotgalibacillus proteolyticus]